MVRTTFVLILDFRIVPHKTACNTLSKVFLKSVKILLMLEVPFSHRIRRLKICSVVLLPALYPTSSSAIISLVEL